MIRPIRNPPPFDDEHKLYEFCKEKRVILHVEDKQLEVMGSEEESGVKISHLRTLAQILPGLGLELLEEAASATFSRTTIKVSERLYDKLQEQIETDDSTIRRLSSWPIARTFVYLDISDFSERDPLQQVSIISSLIGLLPDVFDRMPDMYESIRSDLEAQLCIGDGYIYVFKSPRWGAYFAAKLASRIEESNAHGNAPVSFHFRAGVHTGQVLWFWDPGRENWNYIGKGINGGARILEAVGKELDDVVYISDAVRQRLLAPIDISGMPEATIVKHLSNRGRSKDKHGNIWRVFQMNHTAIDRDFEQ